MSYRRFSVSEHHRKPLIDFIFKALATCGCRILHHSRTDEAPFRITFEAPDGERMGIIAYAFFANQKETRNRPSDEHRFQVKYGPKTGELHDMWQDPFELYTTLFLGINPEAGFFVGADPVLHSPTRFFVSVEFKNQHVEKILDEGWQRWERQKQSKAGLAEPVEVMVGGRPESFLQYVRFERAAKGLSAGHRALLADKIATIGRIGPAAPARALFPPSWSPSLHALAGEFQLAQEEILDLIQSAPRLKMAVRGWVAEAHLEKHFSLIPEIASYRRIEEDGQPDFIVSLEGCSPLRIECKNILRNGPADGTYRLDFQRTRASKEDPCSRYYRPDDFEVIAACLHPQTEHWEFSFAVARQLDPHRKCPDRLSNLVRLDARWQPDVVPVLRQALLHT